MSGRYIGGVVFSAALILVVLYTAALLLTIALQP